MAKLPSGFFQINALETARDRVIFSPNHIGALLSPSPRASAALVEILDDANDDSAAAATDVVVTRQFLQVPAANGAAPPPAVGSNGFAPATAAGGSRHVVSSVAAALSFLEELEERQGASKGSSSQQQQLARGEGFCCWIGFLLFWAFPASAAFGFHSNIQTPTWERRGCPI